MDVLSPSATHSPFAKPSEQLRPPVAKAATYTRSKACCGPAALKAAATRVPAVSREPHTAAPSRKQVRKVKPWGGRALLPDSYRGRSVWGIGGLPPPASRLCARLGAAPTFRCYRHGPLSRCISDALRAGLRRRVRACK